MRDPFGSDDPETAAWHAGDEDDQGAPAPTPRLGRPMAPGRRVVRAPRLPRARWAPAAVVHVLRSATFDVGVRPSTTLVDVPVGAPVRSASWRTGLLVVRVHEVLAFPALQFTLTMSVVEADRDADDPSVAFEAATLASSALTPATTTGGKVWVTPFDASSSWVQVRMRCHTGALVSGAGARLTLSVDLVGRA